MRSLPHVMGRVFNAPLLIAAPKLEALLLALPQVLASRGTSIDQTWMSFIEDEMEATAPQQQGRGYQMTPGGVAVLPVRGVLVRRPGQMQPDSTPLQSYEKLGADIQAAMADRRVRGLLLDIDSPGGESAAVMDLAQQVRASTALKPIWSVANDAMYSAAYAIGSAAQRVWVTRTGGAGSIGVMALHADQSQADAKEGVHYTYVHAGARKIDGNPHGPLGPEATSRMQAEVDRLHGMFTETVARHRGISADAVREQQASLYFADDAVSAGLADQVGTLGDARNALADLVSPPSSRSTSMSLSMSAADPQPEQPEHPAPTPTPTPPPPEPTPRPVPNPPPEQQPPPTPQPEPQREALADPIPQRVSGGAHTAHVPDNVFHLDVAQVTAAQKHLDREIAAACRIAKRPELAEEMIASSMTLEQIKDDLMRRMAADADRNPITAIDPGNRRADPSQPSLVNLGREVFAARFARR